MPDGCLHRSGNFPRKFADVSPFGLQASVYMPTIGKVTIMMLLRNL